MTTYSRPGRPQVHGTVDPDRLAPERLCVDAALLEEFNAGVRRARAGVPLYPCRHCARAKSGRCRQHEEDA